MLRGLLWLPVQRVLRCAVFSGEIDYAQPDLWPGPSSRIPKFDLDER